MAHRSSHGHDKDKLLYLSHLYRYRINVVCCLPYSDSYLSVMGHTFLKTSNILIRRLRCNVNRQCQAERRPFNCQVPLQKQALCVSKVMSLRLDKNTIPELSTKTQLPVDISSLYLPTPFLPLSVNTQKHAHAVCSSSFASV